MLRTDGFSFPPRKKNLLSTASGPLFTPVKRFEPVPLFSDVYCDWEEVSRGREGPGLSPCLLDHLAELWRIGDPLALFMAHT